MTENTFGRSNIFAEKKNYKLCEVKIIQDSRRPELFPGLMETAHLLLEEGQARMKAID